MKGKQFQENGVVRNDEIWLVVRSLKNAEGKINYKLAKNDIIKLGRVKFRIKDLFIPGIDGESRVMDVPFEEIIISKDFEMKEGYHCRFCWMDEQNDDNPLISACKCAGTMGLVHLECLKAWQTTKMQTKRTDNLISLYWKTFECEICKTPYPFKVRHKDNTFRLVDVEVPPSQCRLVLESLIFDKNSSRMIHVMTPSSTKRVYKMVSYPSLTPGPRTRQRRESERHLGVPLPRADLVRRRPLRAGGQRVQVRHAGAGERPAAHRERLLQGRPDRPHCRQLLHQKQLTHPRAEAPVPPLHALA